jgi:tRNA pseudouridine55 synthase
VERTYFGFLNIAKPAGITAHDVVGIVRKTLRIKQVGHGGTLDPAATGVLPVAVGKATRLLRFLPGEKTYLAEIKLGLSTTTDDTTGETIAESADLPAPGELTSGLSAFRGELRQVPPMYSAVHVDGRRLYEMARKGEAPDTVPEREVVVHALDLLSYEPPVVTVRIKCSAGTYIRSIARDLGANLGCGGCLQSLVREQAGPFKLSAAVTLDELKRHAADSSLEQVILPPEKILDLDSYNVDEKQALQLQRGQALDLPAAGESDERQHVLALLQGNLIAVCKRTPDGAGSLVKIQPEVVLADASQAGG